MSGPVDGKGGGWSLPDEAGLPPAGPALLEQIGAMKAVPTRVPLRSALVMGLAAASVLAAFLIFIGTRPDLAALPAIWVVSVAAAWTAGLLAALLAATLPRRGQVLPDAARAGRVALVVAVALLLIGLFATVDAPGAAIVPEGWPAFGQRWWHCTSLSLKAIFPLLLLGGLLQRRIFPVGGVRIAAALGAAAGAIAGLGLHFVCPIGGALHVGLAHAGGVILGAILGMLLLPAVLRTS